MSYQEHAEIPAYEHVAIVDGEMMPATAGKFRWSNAAPPPAIGAYVDVAVNDVGLATVTGYFTVGGYLGLVLRVHSDESVGKAFGAEILL